MSKKFWGLHCLPSAKRTARHIRISFSTEDVLIHKRKLLVLAKFFLLLLLTFTFYVESSAASALDSPHNETNDMTCGSCHLYSFWWRYSPVSATSDYPTLVDSVCNQCHGNAGPAFVKASHSTASMGTPHPVAGTWSTKCVDCHDPHLQQQVNWLPSTPIFNDGSMADGFFLVEGKMTTIQNIGDGKTTFGFSNGLAKPGWEDAADWTMKSGHDGRGLILSLGYGKTEQTYEVVASSITTSMPSALPANGSGIITVQTGNATIPTKYENTPFGLFYGQLVKSTIKTPHSGSKSVKFLDGKDGLTTTSASPRDGVCQVCHTVTKYWRNNGATDSSTELHNPTITCTSCHHSGTGFKPSGGPHPFLDETAICKICHTSSDILAIHRNNCQHCHTIPPALADPANKPLVSAILKGTCQDCHGEKAHPTETAHNHRQKTESCATCHAVTNAASVDALHKHDCATCHGYAGTKLNQYTVANTIARGMSGFDVTCQSCHTVDHATETEHNQRKSMTSCAICHTVSSQTAIDTLHTQGCITCHGYSGSKLNQTTVADAITSGKGANGNDVNCQTCHTIGHNSETDHNHRQSVAATCAVCHTIIPEEIDAVHKNCLKCHGYTGTKLDASTVANAISTGKGPNGTDVTCQTCHVTDHKVILSRGTAMNYLIYKEGEPFGTNCVTCHVPTAAAPAHNNLRTVTPCSDCHGSLVTEGFDSFASIWLVHNNDCLKCHFSDRPEVQAAISVGRADPGTPVDCTTCHGASKHADNTATHNNRLTVDSCASCHIIVLTDMATAVNTLHKSNCKTCHAYTGTKLDKTAVANAINTGKGNGTAVDCRTCHTDNRSHHDSPEAVNNDCTITCHTVVDHSKTVAPNAICTSCHTSTAGTTAGVPLSLSDAAIHDSCRTCHTFDANKRGVMVNSTNIKGVEGSGALPSGNGDCTNCHTAPLMSTYHHASPRTSVGQCETCHVDPRPSWGPNNPGDNVNGVVVKGATQTMPTQMACLKCHVTFANGNMTVTKFKNRSSYTSYRDPWETEVAHAIPVSGTRINNFGICLSCHFKGSTKVPPSAWVTLWHAHPSRFGGSAWTFYNQGYDEYTGKNILRGSGSLSPAPSGDNAHYVPGRSKSYEASQAPQSGISGFNLFAPNYSQPMHSEYWLDANLTSDGADRYAYKSPAYDTPAFTRIAVPTTAKLGDPSSETLDATTRSVPVFASLAPLVNPPQTTDRAKVKNATYNSSLSLLTVVASTSNASGCSTLKTWYDGASYDMPPPANAPSNCTATIATASPASDATVDVTTTNSLGLNVMGYRIASPNPGALAFSTSTDSVTENVSGGKATITISRTGGSTGTVGVTYTTSNGTATSGTDYTSTSGTIEFADGETDRTFTINILADTTPESNKTVNLTLSDPTGGAILGRPNTSQLTIVDDDLLAGTIALTAPIYTVAEDAGMATITVKRTGSFIGKVSVDYTTNPNDSTAKAGRNYTPSAGTLVFEEGEENATKTFSVPILVDLMDVQNRTLNLFINNPTDGVVLGDQNTAVLAIITPAVAALDAWPIAPQLTGTSGDLNGSFTIGEGTNRLLLMAVSCQANAGETGQTFSATYGGKQLIKATLQNSSQRQTWIGYLNEADIAARTDDAVDVTVTGTHTGVAAFIASYKNVNQIDPIAASGGSWVPIGGGDLPIYATPHLIAPGGYSIYNWASSTTTRLSDDENYTENAESTLNGIKLGIASKPFPSAASTNPTISWHQGLGPNGVSVSGITLNSYAGPAVVAFTSPTYSVKEDGGLATITVSRLRQETGTVKVHYATADGYSSAGVHYIATSGDLEWGDNDMANKTFSVPIIDDLVSHYRDLTVNLGLTSPTNGAILGSPTTAELTIVNDEAAIAFTKSTYKVNEYGGKAIITVRRAHSSTEEVSVHCATTAGGTATPVTDYTPVDSMLAWGVGDMADKTFEITILNNTACADDKTINLTLTDPSGRAVLESPQTAVLTITEDEKSLAFTASAYSVNENDGTATITASRTGLSTDAVEVHYETIAGGTAIANTDYTATSGTLRWAAGDMTNQTFPIAILNNSVVDGYKTVKMVLTSPTYGVLLGSPNTAFLTIADDEVSAKIAFTASTYSVNENGGEATITVSRTDSNVGAVAVNYSTTADGTATPDADFIPKSGTLNWAAGNMSDQTFTISIIDNQAYNADNKTIALALSSPTAELATLGIPSSALLTIVNDEPEPPPTIAFVAAGFSVNENGTTATITVSRTGGFSEMAVGVSYATNGVSALAGTHYTETSGTLLWAASDMTDKTFSVNIIDNTEYSINRRVSLLLSDATGGAILGNPLSAYLTIIENEVPATLAFAASNYSINENDVSGMATFTVKRTGNSIGEVKAYYQTVDGVGTAIQGVDYTWTWGYLTWANGDMTDKTFSVNIANNTVWSVDKTVVVGLYDNGNMGNATLGSPTSTTLTIVNDDPLPPSTITLSNSAYSVNENGGTSTITASRTGDPAGPVCVSYAIAAGITATAGVDYTATPGTLCWANGETGNKTFAVGIIDNSYYGGDKTVNLALSSPTGATILGSPSTAVLTIVDNETPLPNTIALTSATYSVNEDSGIATITVSRTGPSTEAVSVNYAISNGTAINGNGGGTVYDYYIYYPNGTLTWDNGDMTDKTFSFSIRDNAVYEADKTVNLALSAVSGGTMTLGNPNTAVLTIVGNESAISFSSSAYSVDENSGAAIITARRNGSSRGAAVVTWHDNYGGTAMATEGSDYTYQPSPKTLSWADGDMSDKTIIINLIDDSVFEVDETVDLQLISTTGNATIATPYQTVLTIKDNENATLAFTASAYSVKETDGMATITVSRSGYSNGVVTVSYETTTGGTATTGVDYTAVSGTLTWPSGVMGDISFAVPIFYNQGSTDNNTVKLSLTSPTGRAILPSGENTAELTIADNQTSFAFSASSYSVNEGTGTATITVHRSGTSTGAVNVWYENPFDETPNGPGEARGGSSATNPVGSDYRWLYGMLTWQAGDITDKTFTVTIYDDAVHEGDETVNLRLWLNEPPISWSLGTPGTAVLTIIDDD